MDSSQSNKISPEAAGYMELSGAEKDGACTIVEVPDGVSKQLGCCNLFLPEPKADRFHCGDCKFLEGSQPILLGMRHGTTDANEEGRFRSIENVPLDEEGRSIARKAAEYIKKRADIKTIIHSPLDRAKETAAIVAEVLGLSEVFADKRLLPWNMGMLGGKKKSEYGDVVKYLVAHPDMKAPGGGDSLNETRKRFRPALDEFLSIATPQNQILLIFHGTEVIDTETYYGDSGPTDAEVVEPGGVLALYPKGDSYHAEPFFGKVKRGTFGS